MNKLLIFLIVLVGAALLSFVVSGPNCGRAAERVQWPVMGTVAGLSVRGGNAEVRDAARLIAHDVFARLDGLLSAWNPASELSRVAPLPEDEMLAKVSPETRRCYEAAFAFVRESGGAFNPWVGKTLKTLDSDSRRHASDFDLGAIAKGFAVDVAFDAIRAANTNAEILIDLGGNLRAVGGEWTTGVRNPFAKGNAAQFMLRPGEAVATSGNYERFVVVDGVRRSHILDGRTGRPTTGIAGVTVVHPSSAMLADALSTTLFVLGPKAGAEFVAKFHPEASALWIPDEPDSPCIVATERMATRLNRPLWPVEVVK